MPLPPYIAARRATDARDAEDYQTMFADAPGAVAAPTAALHFTPALMAALAAAGIGHATLTLHVGAGTFLRSRPGTRAATGCTPNGAASTGPPADRLNAVRAAGAA